MGIFKQPACLFPHVCFQCRKSFKKSYNLWNEEPKYFCPECGNLLTPLSRKFKAPPKAAVEEWKIVEYLVSQGFWYNTIWFNGQRGEYPKTMKEAVAFVQAYKQYWQKDSPIEKDEMGSEAEMSR